MTSPNWYDQEPYCVTFEESILVNQTYNIPRIIEKAKEREREREFHINCRNCGASTSFSPNDLNPHQQVDNE